MQYDAHMAYTIQTAAAYIIHSVKDHSDAPHLDAERILLAVTKKRDASFLLAHGEDPLDDQSLRQIRHMTALRASGMPLAYILGEAEFYGRTFLVTPDTLIPRPETEELIRQALAYAKQHQSPNIAIADIGTGSGVIAITLALEYPSASLIATDISSAALAVARQNARAHGVEDRIEFLEGDMHHPLNGRVVDLIVSNPPYVPTDELQKAGDTIESRGLLFEPAIALDGGSDGQAFVQQITSLPIPSIIETTGGTIITA